MKQFLLLVLLLPLFFCNYAKAEEIQYNNYPIFADKATMLFYCRDQMLDRNEIIQFIYEGPEQSSYFCNNDGKYQIFEDVLKIDYDYLQTKNLRDLGDGSVLYRYLSNWDTSLSYKELPKKQILVTLSLEYQQSLKEEYLANKKILSIIKKMNIQNKSDFKKAKAIHSWILKHFSYYKDFSVVKDGEKVILYGYTDYDGLFNQKKTVCNGYSIMFKKMCEAAGLDSYTCAGYARFSAHSWNYVKINNKWYCVDSTWDQTLMQYNPYQHFLICNKKFMKERSFYSEVNLYPDNMVFAQSNYSIVVTYCNKKGKQIKKQVKNIGLMSNLPRIKRRNKVYKSWYFDKKCKKEVTWRSLLTKNITLYGK